MSKWKFVDNGCEIYITVIKNPTVPNDEVFDTFEQAKEYMLEYIEYKIEAYQETLKFVEQSEEKDYV